MKWAVTADRHVRSMWCNSVFIPGTCIIKRKQTLDPSPDASLPLDIQGKTKRTTAANKLMFAYWCDNYIILRWRFCDLFTYFSTKLFL